MLEPALGKGAVRRFVLGQFADDLHLRAGMAQHVHEVVDDHIQRIVHQGVHALGELLPCGDVGDLVVAVLDVLAKALQHFSCFLALFLYFVPILDLYI